MLTWLVIDTGSYVLIRTICSFAATLALATPAFAQADMMVMQHDMAANQLGLMEYCQVQGFTDGSAVTAERASIAALPAATSPASMASAEALGKQGTLSANGQSYTLSSMASTHNTTEAAMCKQMADNAVKVQAMQHRAGMPGMPGMPAMPSAGSMPAMPAMPSMPAMPH